MSGTVLVSELCRAKSGSAEAQRVMAEGTKLAESKTLSAGSCCVGEVGQSAETEEKRESEDMVERLGCLEECDTRS